MKNRHFVRTVTVWAVLCLFCSCIFGVSTGAYDSLKVAVCADLPLFHYIDEQGTVTGMHIDILEFIAKNKGFQLEYMVYDRVSAAIQALTNAEVDIVLGALQTDIAGTEKVSFTESLSSASICMISNRQNQEKVLYDGYGNAQYRIAFELGSVSYSQMSRFDTKYITACGSQQQLYGILTKNQAEAVVGIKDSLMFLLEQSGIRDDYVITTSHIDYVDYKLLVREQDRALLSALNDAISNLRTTSSYNTIQNKWLVDLDKQDMQIRIRKLLWGSGAVLGIAVIIIGGFYYMNTRLKMMVDEKTAELNQKVLQLEAASNLRNRLVEHSPGGNLLVQQDGTVLLANTVARAMAGFQEGEQELGNIRDMKLFGQIWERMNSPTISAPEEPELMTVGVGNEKHTYRYQCHPTSSKEEIVLLVEDVTWEERRKQEIFEERKNQTLNHIIAGVAHEIKNPLMSIRTFSSLIYSQREDPEVQAAFQEYVPKEVDRISKMIETLINYARPPREHKADISVRELVNDCVGLAYLSSKKKIDMLEDIQTDTYLYANGDQLRQALVNLLINSIEAVENKMLTQKTPQGNLFVKVSGYREKGEYVLEIYDQGKGMSEEDILQCTDPFFTTKKSGTGMGLALTKQYIRENNGRLEIESVLGEYTRMKMIFKEDTNHEAHRMDH